MASGFSPQSGDIVVKERWRSRSFANTDLDMLLKQHGIAKVIVIGLLANTCIETTGRFAMELGYHVTLVRVPRHAGKGRDRGLQHGQDARRA